MVPTCGLCRRLTQLFCKRRQLLVLLISACPISISVLMPFLYVRGSIPGISSGWLALALAFQLKWLQVSLVVRKLLSALTKLQELAAHGICRLYAGNSPRIDYCKRTMQPQRVNTAYGAPEHVASVALQRKFKSHKGILINGPAADIYPIGVIMFELVSYLCIVTLQAPAQALLVTRCSTADNRGAAV